MSPRAAPGSVATSSRNEASRRGQACGSAFVSFAGTLRPVSFRERRARNGSRRRTEEAQAKHGEHAGHEAASRRLRRELEEDDQPAEDHGRRRVALQAAPTLRPALAIRPNMDRRPPSTEILGSDGMVNLGIGVAVFGRR